MKNVNLQSTYKIHTRDYNKSDTLVVDNGTYELKAGYLGDKIGIKFQNCFFKDPEGLKFITTKLKYSPFTYDLISGFPALEQILDQAFEYLDVQDCNNLIITDAIYSPTKNELVKFLFEVYHFKKIQVGVDAIYSSLYNQISSSVIISMGHSSTCVYVVKDKILDVYKIHYGGKFALTYLTNIIRYKFKEHNKDYLNLVKELRVALDYDKEVINIVEKMKVKNFEDSVSLNQKEVEKEVVVDEEKRNRLVERLKNINKKRKKVESEESKDLDDEVEDMDELDEDDSESVDDSVDELDELDEGEEVEEIEEAEIEENEVKEDENTEIAKVENEINPDDTIKNDESNLDETIIEDEIEIKVKKPMPGLYKMRIYQYNLRIIKLFKKLNKKISHAEEEYEKLTDLPSFLNKKKTRYEQILRDLELREKCRKDATNRKTYEFGLLLKTGELTEEEKEYKKKIKDCEDTAVDEILIKEKDELLDIINNYDPNYILSMSSVLDLISGKNLDMQLINIDLLRVTEVLFEPSLIGSDQMGLSEILENVFSKHLSFDNVFLTGGFSRIKGMKERIEYECMKYNHKKVIMAKDPVEDAFNGACYTDLFETYTYEEYERGEYN